MKYRVEAEFRYKGYIIVDADSEYEAWDITENIDGGEFEEMPETGSCEIEKPQLIEIETKEIFIEEDWGYQTIAKESDEHLAVENGEDIDIFFYVPDDVFYKSNEEIAKFVKENVF